MPPKPDSFTPPVPEDALRFFRNKSLRPSFSFKDVWTEEHHVAFTVAKSHGFDILQDIKDSIETAMESGQTFREFAKDVTPALQEKGWWGRKPVTDPQTGESFAAQLGSPRRLRTIYRSNMRSSRAAGQWERAQRTKETRPWFIYKLGPAETHRDQHVKWAAKPIIARVDDPIWDKLFPPNDYGCVCWLLQVSERRLEAMGYKPQRSVPRLKNREVVNERLGTLENVPVGVSASWNSNPGKVRNDLIGRMLTNKLSSAPLPLQKTLLSDMADRGYIADFVRIAKDEKRLWTIPVMPLTPTIKDLTGTKAGIVTLTEKHAVKQHRERRTNMVVGDHNLIPRMADADLVIRTSERSYALIKNIGGRYYFAVITRYDVDKQIHLVSFRRTNAKNIRSVLSKGDVLYGETREFEK